MDGSQDRVGQDERIRSSLRLEDKSQVLRLPQLSANVLLSPLLEREWTIVAENSLDTSKKSQEGHERGGQEAMSSAVRYVLTRGNSKSVR